MTILNALSIDVEEYFQVSGLADVIRREDWELYPSRLMVGLERVLQVLDKHQIKATFFFLGWVAQHLPQSVEKVAQQGHEIALHGYDHQLIYTQTPEAFEADIQLALQHIRAVYQGPIEGYRAPSFSVREDTLWALDILKKLGFQYDSSIFPFARKRYGIAGAPQHPYEVVPGLMEFPMSTVKVMGKAVPVAGGGYFRLYPEPLTHWAIHSLNQQGQPAMVYLHPWELDPEQPHIQADWANTFRHRINLDQTQSRLDRLCSKFAFGPIKDVLKQTQKGCAHDYPV